MPFCAKWGSRIYGTGFDRARFVMKALVTHQGVLAGVQDSQAGWKAGLQANCHTRLLPNLSDSSPLSIYAAL